jgi:hypothetical protein
LERVVHFIETKIIGDGIQKISVGGLAGRFTVKENKQMISTDEDRFPYNMLLWFSLHGSVWKLIMFNLGFSVEFLSVYVALGTFWV